MISSGQALIGTTIHRVAQLIQQRVDDEIRDSGLTRLSWMAAAHVADADGLTIGDLAARLEVGNATASQLVDRMVRGGWVERSPSPGDRRSQIVTVTAKSRSTIRDLEPRQLLLEDEILRDLSPEERRVLFVLLERIRAWLSR
ncbi:MAG: MarR family winged helix-turn-helix transcriptional regulator [Pseudomonadota bacterium]